jgi:hypothetical protein
MPDKPLPRPNPPSSPPAWDRTDWAIVVGLGAVLLFAVTSQSLWIDETSTASIVTQHSLADWWAQMKRTLGSDLQMPLYMICVWAFAKIVGSSEWALRACGLFWLIPGLIALTRSIDDRRQRIAFCVVAGTSAFIWYYASEARPYAMQVGSACAICGALRMLASPTTDAVTGRKWLIVFLVGLVCLCGSSLLGVIWAAPAVGVLLLLTPSGRLMQWLRSDVLCFVFTAAILAVLAFYYRWTLSQGAHASDAGKTNWQTVAFIFYEELGFSGLGPGRTQLRDEGVHSLAPYLPMISAFGVVLTAVLWRGVKRCCRPSMCPVVFICAATAIFLIGAGMAMHFRVLGRHFTPVMPVVLLLLAAGLSDWWLRPGWMGRSIVLAFVALSVLSSLSIRLAPRHGRDDYRAAAAVANNALQRRQTVWWNAAGAGAEYYHLRVTSVPDQPGAVLVVNPLSTLLAAIPKPDVVIASKPDLYDNAGALRDYLHRNHFHASDHFLEFTVWQE